MRSGYKYVTGYKKKSALRCTVRLNKPQSAVQGGRGRAEARARQKPVLSTRLGGASYPEGRAFNHAMDAPIISDTVPLSRVRVASIAGAASSVGLLGVRGARHCVSPLGVDGLPSTAAFPRAKAPSGCRLTSNISFDSSIC